MNLKRSAIKSYTIIIMKTQCIYQHIFVYKEICTDRLGKVD